MPRAMWMAVANAIGSGTSGDDGAHKRRGAGARREGFIKSSEQSSHGSKSYSQVAADAEDLAS